MLLALGLAFRIQSISLIKINNIKSCKQGVDIRIHDLIKTSRPGSTQPCTWFPFFDEKPQICIARTLVYYLEKTRTIRRNSKNLLISFKEPHNPIGRQTISRWHASTSKASQAGLDINSIKKAAGWSERSSTFAKFYNRPVVFSN